MKGIVADFPHRCAGIGWDENVFVAFLKPIEPPLAFPSGHNSEKNDYISPLVSFAQSNLKRDLKNPEGNKIHKEYTTKIGSCVRKIVH